MIDPADLTDAIRYAEALGSLDMPALWEDEAAAQTGAAFLACHLDVSQAGVLTDLLNTIGFAYRVLQDVDHRADGGDPIARGEVCAELWDTLVTLWALVERDGAR